jgi:hypothetical protein
MLGTLIDIRAEPPRPCMREHEIETCLHLNSGGRMAPRLFTYGCAFTHRCPGQDPTRRGLGVGGSASTFVLGGLPAGSAGTLRALIKRSTDRAIAAQAFMILELIGDGVTVLLFALATPGAVTHVPEQF